MKKNFSVNIQGRLFNVDEDAYEILEKYIFHLKVVFAEEPFQESIINDFQERISQRLNEKLKHLKIQIVTIEIVKQILLDLGFEQQKSKEEETHSNKNQKSTSFKRLYRHPDERYLGGVCGGIAAYFSIDPIIVRIVFAVFTIIFAVGILAYLILWIVVPTAQSPIERLNMKGERITTDKVKQIVKEEFNEVEKSFEKLKKDTFQSYAFAKTRMGKRGVFSFPFFIRFFIGSVFVAISLFFITGFLIILVLPFNHGSSEDIFIKGFPHLGELLFNSALMGSLFQWSLILMFVIPFFSVLIYGITIIAGLTFKTFVLRWWVSQYLSTISSITFILCVVWVYIQFFFLHKHEQKLNFPTTYYSEYVLDIKENDDSAWQLKGKPIIAFEPASENKFSMIVQTRAFGRNSVIAAENSNNIVMNIETYRNTVFIASNWYAETDIWRGQNVKIIFNVPIGRRINLTQSFADNFFPNLASTEMQVVKNRFKMTKKGLEKI